MAPGTAGLLWSAFSLLFVVVGLVAMNAGRKRRARDRRIRNTDPTPVRDLSPDAGGVEVTGTARLAEGATALEAPLSGADALAYHVTVERRGDNNWKTLEERTDSVPFVVDDGTGEARVEVPADATANFEGSSVVVGPGEDPPPGIRQFIDADPDVDDPSEYTVGGLTLGQRRRYTEGRLEPGESAHVYGEATGTDAGWGETAVAVAGGGDPDSFLVSDKSAEELAGENRVVGLFLLAFGGLFAAMGGLFAVTPWLVF